ncbi:MAG TPA: hypothetical protein VHT48_06860, partial [Methylocella sp.]|nr:hypothetical protein [Methylocella sp.]
MIRSRREHQSVAWKIRQGNCGSSCVPSFHSSLAAHALGPCPWLTSIFRYTLFELPEIMAQLLKRKTESKQAFQRVNRQIARKTIAAKRSYLGYVAVKGSIDSGKRW